ncbi:hypothetical protein JXB12_11670 [candidate division KSB1 bacterium]|nr:hypothetical protein [candidate division KSB1 bacterium]
MRKYFGLILIILLVDQGHTQVLLKNTWIMDQPQPYTELRSNGISNMLVQEFDDSSLIWLGTGSGLSKYNTATQQWTTFSQKHGLGKGGVSAFWVERDVIWVATVFDTTTSLGSFQAGGGLSYSLNGGLNWKHLAQPGNTPVQNTTWDIVVVDSSVWITSFGGGLRVTGSDWNDPDWLSPNFDVVWQTITPDEYNFDPLEYLNHRPFSASYEDGVLWIGTAGGINKSLDQGNTWVNFNHQNQDSPISGNWILAIAHQKYDDKNIIWAATWETTSESEDTSEFRGVSKSEDFGYTWKTCLRGESVYNFAFQDSVVYACAINGLFKSIDGGETWAVFPPIVDYEIDERIYSNEVYSAGVSKPGVLWVGTGDGLASTGDDGFTWKIYRAFKRTGVEGEVRTYAYPNPFSPLRHNQLGGDGHVRFQYNTLNSTRVTLRIFTYAMELVTTVVENKSRPGNSDFTEIWNGKTADGRLVANGVYFYQLILEDDGTHWGKLLIFD